MPGETQSAFKISGVSRLWGGVSGDFRVRNIFPDGGSEDEDEFASQQGSMKIFLLYGLGGAGKTQLALEFKKKFKQKFTRIFYIHANTVEHIQGSYWDVATTMQNQIIQNWQSGLHLLEATEENWLLIINNADDPSLHLEMQTYSQLLMILWSCKIWLQMKALNY
ncbi:hypothetical protein FB446DRAFT_820018 [Lentinula raphanica]|nr:hypothetical protein FB446DRAFT_820018 [Lentinula raphanica]